MKSSQAEIVYQITMKYVKQMLEKNLITCEEYQKINDELDAKYSAKISHLFLENTWYIYTLEWYIVMIKMEVWNA